LYQTQALKNGRPTIAVLGASMTSFYHEEIMRGVQAAAEEKEINVIFYSGGPLNNPDKTVQSRETVFDLINMDIVDGVIAPFSSHSRYLTAQESQAFINRFSSHPIVNIGSQFKGCLNIIPDFKPGLTALINHYVKDHKYKKIALFRGPKTHQSSDYRTQVFKEQLQKHGITVDENLIVYSDMDYKNGQKSIADFIDNKKLTCDAIVSLNDQMAFGIIEALQKHNIRVPEDIAVSGTMNVPEGIFSNPPLTTIQEPIYELGKTAVYALLDKLNGLEPPSTTFVPTSLVIRNSCGCSSFVNNKKTDKNLSVSKPLDSLTTDNEKSIDCKCLNILKQVRCIEDSGRLSSIINKYKEAKENQNYTSFILALSNQLEHISNAENLMGWLEITSQIQINLFHESANSDNPKFYTECLEQLILLKDRTENKLVQLQKFGLKHSNNFLQELLKTLNASFDLVAIKDLVLETLHTADFYISVYSKENDTSIAENILAVRKKQVVTIQEKDRIFRANKLITSSGIFYEERYSLIVFPLSFRKSPLGFLLLNFSENNFLTYENLQVIISTALKNELQIQDLKKAEERFSDIAHSTSNWLWETDKNNVFTYSSLSVFDIIGYSSEETIGYKINSFSIIEKDDCYQKLLNREIFSDKECWFHHKNGDPRCLLISARPIFKDGLFEGYRGVFKDVTKQKSQDNKINHLAFYDILTDLPNRAMFMQKLEDIITSSTKKKSKFALIFLDIDRFKYINDSMGHASGDFMLTHVAQILQNSIRDHDVLARLGGDEFTIILPNIEKEADVLLIAKRITKNLETPILLKDRLFHVTMSFGIAMYPNDGEDSVTLLKKADNAMYQAKSQGRNRFVFYNKKIEQMNAIRKLNEDNLNEALNNNHFILYYQPQVDTFTQDILGVEALVRIKKEKNEIIAPNNFIPLAEELGLIDRIDEWVFNESCRQYSEWQKKGYKDIRMSINLSTLQFRNKDLVKTYMSIIDTHNINPNCLQLEITESTLIENESMALTILEDFKSHGLSIAIDDFGTGYSSFHLINLYPIDTIKIDRSFVKDAINNKKNEAIIKAIVGLANSLNLKIIAEGVETAEQYNFIKTMGCDEIQGYYFYKPACAKDIEKDLKKKNRYN
jgi:diguanylate cyclase (GGDEF)-like protein/PAS domain S-box-containing protein